MIKSLNFLKAEVIKGQYVVPTKTGFRELPTSFYVFIKNYLFCDHQIDVARKPYILSCFTQCP